MKMKKTLYSLMLSEDVVREIDILAHRMGTNRSNLVNSILANHVSLMTPEQQINDIFKALEELMLPSRDIIPFFEPNTPTMSFKSCLEYKYRPTVRYEVELFGSPRNGSVGTLSVIFRTQSASLIDAMARFFRIWKQIEDAYLAPRSGTRDYALYDGKFVRSIGYNRDMTSKELAMGLSDYVQIFDTLMKRYIGGAFDADDVANAYAEKLANGSIVI